MDLDSIAKIAGVLGFIISVMTFALTRYERRAKCVVEICIGDSRQFRDELCTDDFNELIKIRVTNIGGSSVILKAESFFFFALDDKTVSNQGKIDWLGLHSLPSPLKPGESCEVAVFTDALLDILNFSKLDKYCNASNSMKTNVDLLAGVKDLNNKAYISKGFKYFYYVNALERIT
ncbi:TPA: hypothetical protein ACQYCL_003576 [Vibrio parahaemolyticus]